MEYTKEYKLRPKIIKAFQYNKNNKYNHMDIQIDSNNKDWAGVHYTCNPYDYKISCTITNEEINDGDYVVILDTYNRKVMSKEEFEKEYEEVTNG